MRPDKEKILILFGGPHLAYSPTVIQLYDALSDKYEVTIIAQNPDNYNGQALNDRNVLYHKYYKVKGRHFYLALFQLLSLFNKEARSFKVNKLGYKDYFFRFLFMKKHIRKQPGYKTIISVDIRNLFYCSLLNAKTDFVSLELCADEQLLPMINMDIIRCVIIQSPERYNYLFKDTLIETFYIQNAPTFKELPLKKNRKELIYTGGAYNFMGFYHCLDFLKAYPDEKMTVQGAVLNAEKERINSEYSDLINEKRLVMNNNYLDNEKVVEYISDFEIGFCFYNFDDPFIKDNYFNYMTAPSGKMFKYLAAGVPVVCSNITGFQFVKEFQCGVLADSLSAEDIRKALLTIRKNYDFYVANAIKAAMHYSFDKTVAPYLASLES